MNSIPGSNSFIDTSQKMLGQSTDNSVKEPQTKSIRQRMWEKAHSFASKIFSNDSQTKGSTISLPPQSRNSFFASNAKLSSFDNSQLDTIVQEVKQQPIETTQELIDKTSNQEDKRSKSNKHFKAVDVVNQPDSSTSKEIGLPLPHQGSFIDSHAFPIYQIDLQEIILQGEARSKALLELQAKFTKDIVNFLQTQGEKYFLEAQRTNQRQVVEIENKTLIFTPSGKVYLSIAELGMGVSKTTSKVALIGSTLPDLISQFIKLRAFSLTKDKNSLSSIEDKKMLQNEIKLNAYMKEQAKTHDLSNVCFAKSISMINDNQIGMMAELCDGDIDSLVAEFSQHFTLSDMYFLMAQMATATAQLHKIGIVHRDLKTDNFLFVRDPEGKIIKVKVTDFGVSSRVQENERYESTIFPFYFVDPTWLLQPNYEGAPQFSTESDIYQLGVNFYQVLQGWSLDELYEYFQEEATAVQPDKDKNLTESMRIVKQSPNNWKGINNIQNPKVKQMILRMLSPNPTERPTAQEVAAFFNQEYLKAQKLNPSIKDTAQKLEKTEKQKKKSVNMGYLS